MAAAQPIRDGLLVHRSPEVVTRLLGDLAAFAGAGGLAAVHIGDAGCGGGGFDQPPAEHADSLQMFRALETAALPRGFPVYHVPGNHDVAPTSADRPGLDVWREHLGPPPTVAPSSTSSAVSHVTTTAASTSNGVTKTMRAAHHLVHVGRHWRLLLLDSMDGVDRDVDGHGHIGPGQVQWLDEQLQAAERARAHVVLGMHQLLLDPTVAHHGASGGGVHEREQHRRRLARVKGTRSGGDVLDPMADASMPAWIAEGDMIDNRHEVLQLLSRYPHVVRFALHGHIHANTLTTWHGIDFITLAATTEYPMQWFELALGECTASLVARPLGLSGLRAESHVRDNRPWRNELKRGRLVRNGSAHAGGGGGGGISGVTVVEELDDPLLVADGELQYEWEWPGCHEHEHVEHPARAKAEAHDHEAQAAAVPPAKHRDRRDR